MRRIDHFPDAVCASRISVWVEGGVIRKAEFADACDGNTQGLARLVVGRTPAEVIALLRDIDCEGKGTSCPDQLARALEQEFEAPPKPLILP